MGLLSRDEDAPRAEKVLASAKLAYAKLRRVFVDDNHA